MAVSPRSDSILDDLEPRPVSLSESDFADPRLFLGKGDAAVEVVVATARSQPPPPRLRSAWKARVAGRAAPVLLAVLHPGGCALCAPSAGDSQVWLSLDLRQVERLCRAALDQPNRHAALRLLAGALPEIDSPTPGLRSVVPIRARSLRNPAYQAVAGCETSMRSGCTLASADSIRGERDVALVLSIGSLAAAVGCLVTALLLPRQAEERNSAAAPAFRIEF